MIDNITAMEYSARGNLFQAHIDKIESEIFDAAEFGYHSINYRVCTNPETRERIVGCLEAGGYVVDITEFGPTCVTINICWFIPNFKE